MTAGVVANANVGKANDKLAASSGGKSPQPVTRPHGETHADAALLSPELAEEPETIDDDFA